VLIVSHFKKIKFLAFGDCVAPGVLLAQGIGRWGNFMNGEAFGYETNWFCRMGLQNPLTAGQYMEVHPTFLYESLWNLLGVLGVYLFAKFIGKKYDGQLVLMIFGWYGLGRMFIEGLRTDSLYIPGTELRTSQVLAAAIFVVCLGLLIYFFIKKPKAPLYHKAPAAVEAEESFPLFDKIKELFSAKKDDSTEAKKDEKPEENGEESKENEE
jgi:phosphatidylglycerol:prolipoprotein diacylglycerol transferase